ncbi:holo-ACP synthase [Spirochaeta lutea]|uniref:Holo-[acyl-carrier-protein] synthase n=1 Tax=Spirochaeta lutea TaxID=1480694 RepID=A0A098QZA7_9SPIO|nr:holo-ACP synthase [Spirochaeta lutea]KGE72831.1 hypothetical protein DC28_05530 [Spirochaeta lutea]
MIYGTGVDIAEVSRFRTWVDNPGLMERFFNPGEIREVLARGQGAEARLAVRFAAKEAYGKALGTGLRGISLVDVWVRNDASGRPELVLEGRVRQQYESLGLKARHVSLSHDGGMAIAFVVLEW